MLSRLPAVAGLLVALGSFALAANPTSLPLSALRDDEKRTRELLTQVNEQLDRLAQATSNTPDADSSKLIQRKRAALEDLLKQYQIRLDDLQRSLRELVIRPSVGSAGMPEQLNAKEKELKYLLQTQVEVARNASDASAAFKQAVEKLNNGEELPAVEEQVKKDIKSAKEKLQDLDTLPQPRTLDWKTKRDAAQKELDEQAAATRAKTTAAVMEALRSQKETTENQVKSVTSKIEAAKADLRDLSDAMNKYITSRDEERSLRERLRKVDDEIAQLQLEEKINGDPETAKQEAQNKLLERSVQLNNLKQKYQFRLDELRRQIRDAEERQPAELFAGTVDVYLDGARLDKAAITGATYDGTYEIGGRRFVRLKTGGASWAIDPEKVVAVKSTGGATTRPAEK